MAAVAEMGEVDEIHSNEEGIVLNGDITKDVDMENKDVNMESVSVKKIPQEEIADRDVSMDSKDASMDSKDASMDSKDASMDSKDASMDSKDASMDSKDDLEMERDEETCSQSAADEDSQESGDSQEDKSQGSPESQDQDSNMESEQINEENASSHDENEDTNTNSSVPQNENLPQTEENEHSNVSSQKNEDEDSRSSTEEINETKTQDPLFNENSQELQPESDKKSQQGDQDQEVSQDGSESKSESAKINEPSENGTEERAPSAASSAVSAHEIHEIDDDKNDKIKAHETIELNESEDDGDVMIVDGPKTNGTTEVIDLIDTTPEKKIKEKKDKEHVTPRRSSRNLNKNKSYVESDKEDTPPPPPAVDESEESDIEEILPQDPLAVNDQITVERIPSVKKTTSDTPGTIVVSDTKRLVEIATKTNQNNTNNASQGKKEPTLVIIDTNSILSGRGPVPVPAPKPTQAVTVTAPNFQSMLPVAVPAQGMYPANMRATITPIPVNTMTVQKSSPIMASMQTTVAPLLPTLTDDMFVVEAPSFIVPYVYEKPPVKVLKDFVGDIKKQIQENKAKEKKERREKREKEKIERREKEKSENEDKQKGEGEETDASYSSEEESEEEKPEAKKPYSYFDSPLGKFFIDIGMNMVQEYVQNDLLKQQKRKREREQGSNPETNKTIASLMKNIEMSKENNEHFKMEVKKCEFCNFKTESKLVMAYHLETPHMKNFVYKCNFCPYEVRSPHDILFHMEAEHAVRGHLERAPAFHQCPSCPFEDNQKGKLSRHLVVCARKFKPDRNLEPPPDWEPPAKIPRMPKMRATGLNATVAAYQTLAANKGAQQYQFLSKMQLQQANAANSALNRGRGRPTLGPNMKAQPIIRPQGMIFKQQTGGQVLVPANYQMAGNQVFQVVGGTELGGRLGPVPGMAFVPSSAQLPGSIQAAQAQQTVKKPANTPSISITPLPRGTTASPAMASKPGDTNSKNSFVICEICDGYIKDLEQLRNHMQWIHKIKIHPKMIYNRPPLNCQKCQFRFFTDQGLERHLLGSHGLVTSSMQDAANKSKDSGRCPVCGRVYQWKLLNHVARDHNMTLKPAHLSYKCTVCTATFGMYKQFENHVYSAHSVVAKRVMDKKSTSASPSAAKTSDMKPLKINDEITIIPQPAKSTNGASKEGSPAPKSTPGTSKNEDEASLSRAERLARRNASATDSD